MDIGAWLRGLGLGQYEATFRENEIEADVLPELTDQHLKDLGISLGHRLKILRAIRELAAGGPLGNRPVAEPAPSPQGAAERRQLTVMFSDLVGSTALSARLDPEDMRRVIRAYQDAVSGVVARYEGFVAKFMGDGVLAYFGFPRAHEDDAARAVHAGLEIAQVVAGLETPARENLAARIGVATGLVVVGDIVGQGAAQEQAVVGDTPNLAARLQGLADAGEVVISAATRRLVGDGFRLRDLGRHAVKGLAEPVEAWSALGVASTESRFEAAHASRLTGFVGRETEAADLLARQRRAWSGRGQIVLISGEAGIGKSRLSAWVAEQAAQTLHTRLRYQCSPFHRDSALYPFAQQFERAAGLTAQDSAEAKLDKLENVLALATDRLDEVAPLIAAMLSIPTGTRHPALNLSPAQQRRQTLFALLDQMEGLAKRQPILMLFEDAQWADATSLEVLDLAIERMRKLPVLLLITFRPEFEAPWRGLPDVADIALGRLERVEAEALVERVTGGRKLPAEVLAQIVAKTDGVPLFVEELTKNVLESGLLIEEPESYRLDGPLPPLAIPSTLQDSLMARLDRLAAVKEIAQIGAAIGREFSYALLQAVVGRDEATLKASLAQLEESELVFRSGEPPAARYTFKHALVQDTAYESLLRSRRQILHQRIAEALCDKFPDLVDAEPELIAEHYTRAGLTEPAIVHWGKAGDLALRRSAFKEAIAHLSKAIEMTEAAAGEKEKPAGKLKLQVALGHATLAARGYGAPETAAAFARAKETAVGAEGTLEWFSVTYGLWSGAFVRGDYPSMRELADAFLRNIEDRSNTREACVGHRIAGVTAWYRGEFETARIHLEKALALFDAERDRDSGLHFGQDLGVAAMIYLAFTLWPLGEAARVSGLVRAWNARTAQLEHPGSIAYGANHAFFLELMRGHFERASAPAEQVARVARENDMRFFSLYEVFESGWRIWQEGDHTLGLSEMRRGIEIMRDQHVAVVRSGLCVELARRESESGDVAAALATLDRATADSRHMGEQWFDAELHRARGDILLKQTPADSAPAEAAFLTAIAVAQSQKARSFELRAALALAKLYQSTNRHVEAHDVLGPSLEGFSPTPEFPEIAEAKTLFEALAGMDEVKAVVTARKQRVQLQISLGNALIAARGYSAPETTAAFARAREIVDEDNQSPERFSVAYGLWVGSYMRVELPEMRQAAGAFLSDARARGPAPEAGIAHRIVGVTHWVGGDFVQARAHFENALAIFDPARDGDLAFRFGQDVGVGAMAYQALALWPLGEVERAVRSMEGAIARASGIKHVGTVAYANMHATVFEMMRGNFAGAAPFASALAELAREHDLKLWRAFGVFLDGWRAWRQNDPARGRTEMRRGFALLHDQHIVIFDGILRCAFAGAEAESGDFAAALTCLEQALVVSQRTGGRWFDAEVFRTRGDILIKQNPANPAPAEAAFRTAIAIAQSQKARSFELCAALALAKLRQSNGRPVEAQDVLGPALEGFSPTPEFPEIAETLNVLASIQPNVGD